MPLLAWLLFAAIPASGATEGRIVGVVLDGARAPVAGAVVRAAGSSLPGGRAVVAGRDGSFRLERLVPGTYAVSADLPSVGSAREDAVVVPAGRTVSLELVLALPGGEITVLAERQPIDPLSTASGSAISPRMIEDIPNYRLLTYTLQLVPGMSRAATDQAAFSGAGAAENAWLVDGVNAGSLLTGAGSAAAVYLPSRDVEQLAVETGGASADSPAAAGAVIEVSTRSGGDLWHASSEFGWTGQGLSSRARDVSFGNDSLAQRIEMARFHTLATDLSGPLANGRAHVRLGLSAPRRVKRWTRVVRRAEGFDDRDGDGAFDPISDSLRFRAVAEDSVDSSNTLFQPFVKLNVRLSDSHALSATYLGTYNRIEGNADVLGTDLRAEMTSLLGEVVTDGSIARLGWSGEFRGGAVLSDAFIALFADRQEAHAWGISHGRRRVAIAPESGNGIPLATFDPRFADDPATAFPEYPVYSFAHGGYGGEARRFGRRWQAAASITVFFRLAGDHRLRLGVEGTRERFEERLGYLGGALEIELRPQSGLPTLGPRIERWRTEEDPRVVSNAFDRPWVDSLTVSHALAAFVQDHWAISRAVVFTAGLRVTRQSLGGDDGSDGFAFPLAAAPKVGLLWDWTGRGASKAYVYAGRIVSTLPAAVSRYAFAADYDSFSVGDRVYSVTGGRALLARSSISLAPCLDMTCAAPYGLATGGDVALRAPLSGEVAAGYEHDIGRIGVLAGARATARRLVRAVDNVYLDGATPILGNPGEGALGTGYALDPTTGYPGAAGAAPIAIPLPRPRREYRALTLFVRLPERRGIHADASYTLSSLSGNFSGPDASEAGKGTLTAAYDVPELMANRDGPLADDARHAFTAFASIGRVTRIGALRGSAAFLARSGRPLDVTGPHYLLAHGDGSVHILPRGSGGRLPWTRSLDLQASYGFRARGYEFELVADVFNVFNELRAVAADDRFTTRAALSNALLFEFYGARPVTDDAALAGALGTAPRAGATLADLKEHPEWVAVATPYGTRPLDRSEVNPNFGKPTKWQDPRFLALTIRVRI